MLKENSSLLRAWVFSAIFHKTVGCIKRYNVGLIVNVAIRIDSQIYASDEMNEKEWHDSIDEES